MSDILDAILGAIPEKPATPEPVHTDEQPATSAMDYSEDFKKQYGTKKKA